MDILLGRHMYHSAQAARVVLCPPKRIRTVTIMAIEGVI